MKLIIPMAGLGKRMRPHTLSMPKPLLRLADKTIVEHIIDDLVLNSGKVVTEVHFVIGSFSQSVNSKLMDIAEKHNTKCFLHHQDEALGTAHAVYCAANALEDEVCIVFADTLYIGDLSIDKKSDAVIWTFHVDNPSDYGVVISDREGYITAFVEKPQKPVSTQAIVGMYYFREGKILKDSIKRLIGKRQTVKGEYQLTDCLMDLVNAGYKFRTQELKNWLDFGNVKNFLSSAALFLQIKDKKSFKTVKGVKINEPVWISEKAKVANSEIGPYVILDDYAEIRNSTISESVIGSETIVYNSRLTNSYIGNYVKITAFEGILNIGDYNEVKGEDIMDNA